MKIAVVDHIGNHGGGSRFIRALLPAIRKARPSAEICFFGNSASIDRESVRADFGLHGISVVCLDSMSLGTSGIFNSKRSAKALAYLQQRFRPFLRRLPFLVSGDLKQELEYRVRQFDIAYFPWPFFLDVPDLDCPIVATIHDLNFKYYFSGAPTFSTQQSLLLNTQIPGWLSSSTPVVSTHFMAKEIEAFYPEHGRHVHVAHLAPMSIESLITVDEANRVIAELGVAPPYILYPTQLCSHKNVGPLLVAMSRLRAQGLKATLILTGAGTGAIQGRSCSVGVALGSKDPDVKGLGYVTNEQMDSLIQCASVVVSPSLYEAGNGPGLDAWARGVPVAMSNIPSFVEHMAVQGVGAEVFDPFDPDDIAAKLAQILNDPVSARESARASQAAIGRMTWETTAERYLEIFDQVVNRSNGR